MNCRVCRRSLPTSSGRGRPRTICDSPGCRKVSKWGVSGEHYPQDCIWCRTPLPPQERGAPRFYCENGPCQKDHLASKWADYHGRLRSRDPLAGVDEEMLGGCTVSQGRDRPLSKSWLARHTTDGWRLDGNCDFNPKMFVDENGIFPEWLTLFLEEFSPQGADPGFSRTRASEYAMDLEKDPRTWWTKGL